MMDGFPQQRHFVLWVSMCPINIIPFLSLVYISATTPRATTPHPCRTGHHAFTTTAQLSRLCISRLPRQGLPRPIFITTCYHTRQSSSYFIVYLSPAFTPPLLLNLLSLAHTARTHSTLSLSVFPFPCQFVFSSCHFSVWFCFAFAFHFASLLSLGADYVLCFSVTALHPPPPRSL